jgi:hypothetical protein
MKVLRVSFVGTRSQRFDATLAMFRDVLGMVAATLRADVAGVVSKEGPAPLERHQLQGRRQNAVGVRAVLSLGCSSSRPCGIAARIC